MKPASPYGSGPAAIRRRFSRSVRGHVMRRYDWMTTRLMAARWARRKTRLRVHIQLRKYPSQITSRPRTTNAMKQVWRIRTVSAARRESVIRRRLYRAIVLVSTKDLRVAARLAAFLDG